MKNLICWLLFEVYGNSNWILLSKIVHEDRFLVHGLNAVYIMDKWVRIDARGTIRILMLNFPWIKEISFPYSGGWEEDYPYIYSNPHSRVIEVMVRSRTVEEAYRNIPTSLTY